ncbi:hypothetical protein ABB02_01565 [Clostridiaceae bacterium JG1575]|nr:hypothetical protein ABB02_01565 [Clostridiaceae bacterium JG1575]
MSLLHKPRARWASALLTLVLLMSGCMSPQAKTTASPPVSAPQQTVEAVVLTPTLLFLPAAADRPADLVAVRGDAVKNLGDPGTLAQVVFQGPFQLSHPKQATVQEARALKKPTQPLMLPIQQAKEFMDALGDSARLVDVRTPEEFKEGHLPNALNVTSEELKTLLPQKVPKKTPSCCCIAVRETAPRKVLEKPEPSDIPWCSIWAVLANIPAPFKTDPSSKTTRWTPEKVPRVVFFCVKKEPRRAQ